MAPSAIAPSAVAAPTANADLVELQRLFALSEPGEAFISDNVISNETSLLQPASALGHLHGGAYIGVGPEQNFTYIALSRPEFAVLIDLRRDNALLHLLYKALFELAGTRLEFLSLLLGRPYDAKLEPAADAQAEQLLATLRRVAPRREWFAEQQLRLKDQIRSYNLGLSEGDLGRIQQMQQLFFERQLELRFELHKANGRKYPSLEQLLTLRSPDGTGTFLDSSTAFGLVQRLQRQHRIVPIVGDVSAPRPMGEIVNALKKRQLSLRAFYISNVEQYLIGTPSFRGWLENLRQLPHDGQSLMLRCYLDQGRPHPRQSPGQRSTNLAQGLQRFLDSSAKELPKSFFQIVTDEALSLNAPERP